VLFCSAVRDGGPDDRSRTCVSSTVASRLRSSGQMERGDEPVRRAPKMMAACAADLQRALHQSYGHGTWAVTIAEMLADTEAGRKAMEAIASRVGPATMTRWRAVIEYHQQSCSAAEDSGLQETERHTVWLPRAIEQVDQLSKRARKAADSQMAPPGVVAPQDEDAVRLDRSAAVGQLRCAFPNMADPRTAAPEEASAISEWRPDVILDCGRGIECIPTRRTVHRCADPQGQEQMDRMRGLGLSRKRAAPDGRSVFSVGAMSALVRKHGPRPPVDALRSQLDVEVLRTMVCTTAGHQWVVERSGRKCVLAPFDVAQSAACMQMAGTGPAVQRMVDDGTLTESQVRSLFGQATHRAAVRLVMDRAAARLVPGWRRELKPNVMAMGAGIGLTALQVCEWLGDGNIAVMVEGCPIARPAGVRLATEMGHSPKVIEEAHDPELGSRRFGILVDIITLQCAPFSKAGDGAMVEAALNELLHVMAAAATRRGE
jgi:hypothetical protein